MKKSILFLCLIALAQYSFSQTFGVRAGVNVAQQVWKVNGEKIKTANAVGALAAVTLSIEQSEKTSGQLELSYSQMGFGETTVGDSLRILAAEYKYLKFGCAFKYHILRSTNAHVGAELGFQFEEAKDLRYLFNPDFGLFIGAEQYVGPYIGVGVRYYLGLADISNVSEDGLTLKQFNRAFQIYVALRIPSRQLKEMGY